MNSIGDAMGLDYSEAFQHVNDEIHRVFRLYRTKLGGTPRVPEQTSQKKASKSSAVNLWMQYIGNNQASPSSENKSTRNPDSELNHYLATNHTEHDPTLDGHDVDLLGWWKEKERTLPQAFNVTGRIIEERWSCLTPETVESIFCLKDWMEADELTIGQSTWSEAKTLGTWGVGSRSSAAAALGVGSPRCRPHGVATAAMRGRATSVLGGGGGGGSWRRQPSARAARRDGSGYVRPHDVGPWRRLSAHPVYNKYNPTIHGPKKKTKNKAPMETQELVRHLFVSQLKNLHKPRKRRNLVGHFFFCPHGKLTSSEYGMVVDALRDPPSPPWLGNDIDTLPQVGNPEDQPDKARERPSTDREEATQSHIINTGVKSEEMGSSHITNFIQTTGSKKLTSVSPSIAAATAQPPSPVTTGPTSTNVIFIPYPETGSLSLRSTQKASAMSRAA
uniref:HAT C-terminal dimerisation domain-containing protein n=1 Tax=Oryza nivara TaxID=4536 RepID=A0A0E0G6V1_ORYNI